MTGPSLDASHLATWVGTSTEAVDTVTPGLVERFSATFDLPMPAGTGTPPGLHWCLAPTASPTAALGTDGHPERGGFLPPVPLPRRMWAGGAVEFHRPLLVGDEVRRVSTIEAVTIKQGRTGPLCFVAVGHRSTVGGETAIVERQDIVYRGPEQAAPARPVASPAPAPAAFTRRLTPTPMLLLRYSALTFNAHRIHYDRRYAREHEGYPALVVHGPLQASLLLQFAVAIAGGTWPRRFAFRSTAPAFDDADLALNADRRGADLALWTTAAGGAPAMQADAFWPADGAGRPSFDRVDA